MGNAPIMLCDANFSAVCVASAVPHSWTETIDWSPDVKPNRTNQWFEYYHDLGDDGFNSDYDTVSAYQLSIRLYDDQDNETEKALIWQPGIFDPDTLTQYNFTFDYVEIGWTLLGLLDINHDGTLNFAIQRIKGDFFVDWSRINACGNQGTAFVPEPATILLLGAVWPG